MKIGILYNGRERSAKTEKICDLGPVTLFCVDIPPNRNKRQKKRQIKRVAKCLHNEGISFCAGGKEFSELCMYGITVVSEGYDILRKRAGPAAVLFSESHGLERDFLIDGGSFSDVLATALFLLERKRHIYVRNPAFHDIAEKIFHETGAVIRKDAPENSVVISLGDREKFCNCDGLSAGFDDFEVTISGISEPRISNENTAALASILEKSGFLEKNRIKIKYFLK